MFLPDSVIVDIPNGSMNALKHIVSHKPVSIVLYYALWCHISRKTARHFEQASQGLLGEVKI